ncbi:RICIN domain-containing protein [Nonomuraea sp. NPDC048892]|uniref:RICIN domain-containing protein n=1 Tax=Nonomuraea sp. NPDC048892 TaxID=3154624 RepID=UPI0033C056C3
MGRRSLTRTLIAMLIAVTGWSALTGNASASTGATLLDDVPPGTYRITLPADTTQCLTAGAKLIDPQRIYVYFDPCQPGDTRQAWSFQPSANPGSPADARRVQSVVFFGRCLDADNRGGRLTGVIHVYACNTSPNQAWQFKGGLGAPGNGCVWVAYLCDVRMVRVPAIPYYDDLPVRLIKPSLEDVNFGRDQFIVQN